MLGLGAIPVLHGEDRLIKEGAQVLAGELGRDLLRELPERVDDSSEVPKAGPGALEVYLGPAAIKPRVSAASSIHFQSGTGSFGCGLRNR